MSSKGKTTLSRTLRGGSEMVESGKGTTPLGSSLRGGSDEVVSGSSLRGGSEEDFDVVCDPCKIHGHTKEAKGFCLNCNQNVCGSCIKDHERFPALQDHVIQTDPRAGGSGATTFGRGPRAQDKDPLTERCPKHPEEVIKFYCNTDQVLGCGVCIPLAHKACTDVDYIRDVSGDFADSDELKTLLEELRHVAALLKFSKARAQHNKAKISERYQKTLEDIDAFKKEIVKYVNELVDELRSEACTLKDEAITAADVQHTSCEALQLDADQMTSDLDNRHSMGLHNGLFVAAKHAKANLPELQKKAETVCSDTNTKRFVFKRDEKINSLVSSRNRIGTVTLASKPRSAKHVCDINTVTDKSICYTSGVVFIPPSHLAIADNKNKSVRLVEVKQRKVFRPLAMPTSPIDLTVYKDKLVVTLKDKKHLQALSLSPSLTKSFDIKTQHMYGGIAYAPDVFYLTPQTSEKDTTIHVCDTSGSLLKKINAGLTDPWYLTVNSSQDILYVGDFQANAVACFNMEGVRITTYTGNSLVGPEGLALDDDGFVYVCSNETDTVHQLTPRGQAVRTVLTKDQGVDYPAAIAYGGGHLYVTSSRNDPGASGVVKVYKLV